jgi:serine/threonine protein phosphatase PrpC
MAIVTIEDQGSRKEQQDRSFVTTVTTVPNLEEIVKKIEKKVCSRELDHTSGSGSTFTLVGLTKTPNGEIEYTISHAGDSPVFIVEQRQFGIWKINQLTKDDVAEKNPNLLTKSLRPYGFDYEPTTATNTIEANESMAFMIATDGMNLNKANSTSEELEKYLTNEFITIEKLPVVLRKWTDKHNNGDNRTAVIVPADDIKEGETIFVGVFDGYNGSKVAEAAKDAATEIIHLIEFKHGQTEQKADPSFFDKYILDPNPSPVTLADALTAKLEEYENVDAITDLDTASFYKNGMKLILDKFMRGEITDKEFTLEICNTYYQLAAYKEQQKRI